IGVDIGISRILPNVQDLEPRHMTVIVCHVNRAIVKGKKVLMSRHGPLPDFGGRSICNRKYPVIEGEQRRGNAVSACRYPRNRRVAYCYRSALAKEIRTDI